MRKRAQVTHSGRIYGGESAADRLARQRRQFMEAGLELFGTVGYRATTVRMLCKQAGLIDRYFYRNFDTTEDLLAAIYTESLDQVEAEVMEIIGTNPAAADAVRLVEAGLNAFFTAFENSRVARTCLLEILGVSPRIDMLYLRRNQQFADLLVNFAKALLPQWNLGEQEARMTGIALVGAISESAKHWLLDDYRVPRGTLVAANARLLQGVLSVGGQGR